MDCNQYQESAHKFARYGETPYYPLLGLCEEAGEVAGKVAKYLRKHGGYFPMINVGDRTAEEDIFIVDMTKELGDVLWMVAECCSMLHLDMGEVMQKNLTKLADRLNRGVIVGEGDNR
jgi:NTP pyrophosphatase (non-canonical NTP hydrolase)